MRVLFYVTIAMLLLTESLSAQTGGSGAPAGGSSVQIPTNTGTTGSITGNTQSSNQSRSTTSSSYNGTSSSGQSSGSTTPSTNIGQSSATATTAAGNKIMAVPGFLYPIDKKGKGFLTPSNAQAKSKTGAGGSASSSRLGGAGLTGGRSGVSGLGSQFGMGAQNGTGTTSAPLRIPMRIAGDAPPAGVPAIVTTRFQARVPKLPAFDSRSSVRMQLEGRTAVLQGSVPTDQQRALLGRLAFLEPGISDVRNELQVDASAVPAAILPAGSSATGSR